MTWFVSFLQPQCKVVSPKEAHCPSINLCDVPNRCRSPQLFARCGPEGSDGEKNVLGNAADIKFTVSTNQNKASLGDFFS